MSRPKEVVDASQTLLRQRLSAPDLPGEPSPAERTPDESADALIDAEGHQLPFVVSADQRVVDLMRDMPRPAVPVGNGERFHQLPAREVGCADVAHLPGP